MQKKDDDEDIEATRDLNQTKWTYFFQHILAHPVNMTHTVLPMTNSNTLTMVAQLVVRILALVLAWFIPYEK